MRWKLWYTHQGRARTVISHHSKKLMWQISLYFIDPASNHSGYYLEPWRDATSNEIKWILKKSWMRGLQFYRENEDGKERIDFSRTDAYLLRNE